MPKGFCNGCKASELFRLRPVILHLRPHRTDSRAHDEVASDGQSPGNGTAFSAVAPSQLPALAARRSNYSGVVLPPGPNSWPLKHSSRLPGSAHPVTFVSIAQECGALATYRGVSPTALLRICTCMTAVRILLRTFLPQLFGLLRPEIGERGRAVPKKTSCDCGAIERFDLTGRQ